MRGNVRLGRFRPGWLDGNGSFADVSQVPLGIGEVCLRLRHLRGRLVVPAGQGAVSTVAPVGLGPARAES